MRVLELPTGASPRDWGQIHGESFRGEIRSLADIRIYLTQKVGGFPSPERVLEVAAAHLPVLERYDADLYQELLGIAEAANLSPAHVIVVNHYTDLRDIDAAAWPDVEVAEARALEPDAFGDGDGGCSVVWAETPSGRLLAQTWDMHATAIPYVLMLRVPEYTCAEDGASRPESWLFSITGCLGMAGMNRAGVAVAINNLNTNDARVGAVWPAVVRRALHSRDARGAAAAIMTSPIGSGHHYMAADAHSAYGIETSGAACKLVFSTDRRSARDPRASYVHTNHCLDADVAGHCRVPGTSTTHERLAWLEQSIAARPIGDLQDVWQRLGSDEGYPRSVCTNMATPENPHGTATCGAIAMELAPSGRLWAEGGFIHNVAPRRFEFHDTRHEKASMP
jgi:isopenicillin-N N-acyltransferase-like protein